MKEEIIEDKMGGDCSEIKKEKISRSKLGKKSRQKGLTFETTVRKNLEKGEWVVAKWPNNINVLTKEIGPSKRKYNPYSRALVIGTGFPDFVAFRKINNLYEVIGVEVKTNGVLSREEKEKCKIYLEKRTFSKILIARKYKVNNKVIVDYTDFLEKYKDKI